jgi:hypothetical protein
VGSVFGPIRFLFPVCRGKQEVGIWWVQKRFPRYGLPIWSLCPNIRFLPSIVAEKNTTKIEHICSMCIKRTRQIPTSCLPTLLTFIHIEHICSFFVAFFSATIDGRNIIFGHKLIPSYMKLVTKYQIPVINSCWEKCDEKCHIVGSVFGTHQIPISCLPTLLTFIHIEHICSFFVTKNASNDMVYLYEACAQISDFCHQ